MVKTRNGFLAAFRLIHRMVATAMVTALLLGRPVFGSQPSPDRPIEAEPVAGSPEREESGPASQPLRSAPFEPVDVLRLIDPEQHVLQGGWSREEGAIVSSDDPACRLVVPYELPEYYELRLVVVRTRGDNALNVGIPVGASHCIVSLDRTRGGRSSGLGHVDGRPSYFPDNETYYPKPVFQNDREHEIRIRARDRRIRVTVDGQSVIGWSGDFSRLSAADREPGDRRPQLLMWHTAFRIKEFTVVPGLELKASLADLRAFSDDLKDRRWSIDREESERELSDAFRDAVQTLLAEQRFADLDELAGYLRRQQPRLPCGLPLQYLFYLALRTPPADASVTADSEEAELPDEVDTEQLGASGGTVASRRERERRWVRQLRALETWRQQRPMSLAAAISLTGALVSYAWEARGTGYADRVTPRGWQDFADRMEQAASVLEEARALGEPDADLARLRMQLGRARGHSRADVEAAFRDGVAIDPGYWPLWTEMATYLLPRWYGLPGDLERFADQAVELTQETVGHSGYAHIVWTVHAYHRFRLFRDFDLSWNKAKQGFEDLLAQGYDSPVVLNRYCLFACAAGDRETAHRLFQRISPDAPGTVWTTRSFPRNRVWADPDSLKGDQRLVLDGHPEAVLSVAFSPDGRTLATAGTRGLVLLHDVASGQEKTAFPLVRRSFPAIAFAPDGKTLAAGSSNGALYSLDLESGRTVELLAQPFPLRHLAFSPDGRVLACTSRDGAVILWNPVSGERLDSIGLAHEQGAVAAAFSPDSKSLISLGRNGDVKIWEWESRELTHTFASQSIAASLAVSADGEFVAVGLWQRAQVFRLPEGELVAEVPVPDFYPMSLAFCPRGQRLALGLGKASGGMEDAPILVWDLQQKAEIKRLEGHRGTLWNITFSPDGTQLASTASDRTARIWQAP